MLHPCGPAQLLSEAAGLLPSSWVLQAPFFLPGLASSPVSLLHHALSFRFIHSIWNPELQAGPPPPGDQCPLCFRVLPPEPGPASRAMLRPRQPARTERAMSHIPSLNASRENSHLHPEPRSSEQRPPQLDWPASQLPYRQGTLTLKQIGRAEGGADAAVLRGGRPPAQLSSGSERPSTQAPQDPSGSVFKHLQGLGPRYPGAAPAVPRRSTHGAQAQYPSASSDLGSVLHFSRTLTLSSRKTGRPRKSSTSAREAVDSALSAVPPLPSRMPRCPSFSTIT